MVSHLHVKGDHLILIQRCSNLKLQMKISMVKFVVKNVFKIPAATRSSEMFISESVRKGQDELYIHCSHTSKCNFSERDM
jgi:hypothetical protein